MKRKLIAMLLTVLMLVSCLPVSALAEDIEEIEAPETEEQTAEVPDTAQETPAADATETTGDADDAAAAETTAVATSGTCGKGLTWSVSGGILTIKGSGTMKGYSAGGGAPAWAACFPTTVIIMKGVKNISNCAFLDGIYITSVTIPISVTSIASFAFHGCYKLKDIYYDGTEAQWNQISMASNTEMPAGVTIHFATPVGWQVVDGQVYYYDNGEPITGIQVIDGKIYGFDENGVMQKGIAEINGTSYYFGSTGAMKTGWQTVKDGKTSNQYYFDPDTGAMLTGRQNVPSGTKTTSYYFDAEGAMQKDYWLTEGSSKYYFNKSGVMVTGLQTIKVDGVSNKYYFDTTTGAMKTGKVQVSSGKKTITCYFDAEGAMQKDYWLTEGSSKYYFNKSGTMVTGLQTIKVDGKSNKYYFDPDTGAMKTGKVQVLSGKKTVTYYFDPDNSGIMRTDYWLLTGTGKYYFNKSGVMATGLQTVKVNKVSYKFYFDTDGKMLTGKQTVVSGKKSTTYYFNTFSDAQSALEEGRDVVMGAMSSGWKQIDGKTYYFKSGVMVAGKTLKINKVSYTFDADGVCSNPPAM